MEWNWTDFLCTSRGLGIVSCLLQRGRNPAHGSETAATTRTGIGLVSRHHRYRHLGSFSFSLTIRLLEMSPLYTITAVSQARTRSLMCENFFELNDSMPGRHQDVVSSSLTAPIPLFLKMRYDEDCCCFCCRLLQTIQRRNEVLDPSCVASPCATNS